MIYPKVFNREAVSPRHPRLKLGTGLEYAEIDREQTKAWRRAQIQGQLNFRKEVNMYFTESLASEKSTLLGALASFVPFTFIILHKWLSAWAQEALQA